jgi:hypothetical protein
MKYAVEMGSGAMTYIPDSTKIGSRINIVVEGIERERDRHGDRITMVG